MADRIDWTAKRDRCPSCGREHESGKRGTFGITPKDDNNAIGRCYRCGFITWRDADDPTFERSSRPLQTRVRHEKLSDYGRELWRTCRPISGTARAYLDARACVIPPADGDLRWRPDLPHKPSGTSGPALVAQVTDAVTREPLTLHRTWTTASGKKAPVEPARMLLGGHRKAGGVIRLWPDESVTTGLAIAEGIETALSVAHAFTPVWACIDAGNLAAFAVLAGIESLLIAADNDEAGIEAAERCAERWAAAGREVRIAMPSTLKTDINDLAQLEAA